MIIDQRATKRLKLTEPSRLFLPLRNQGVEVKSHDLSSSALAVIVPRDHGLMTELPRLFCPEEPLNIQQSEFGEEQAVLDRIYGHGSERTRWIFSFLRHVEYDVS